MDDIRHSLDRVAATGLAMELNTSGANKLIAEMNPFPRHADRDGRIVRFPSASARMHTNRVEWQIGLARHCSYCSKAVDTQQVSFFLERQRHDVSIEGSGRQPCRAGTFIRHQRAEGREFAIPPSTS